MKYLFSVALICVLISVPVANITAYTSEADCESSEGAGKCEKCRDRWVKSGGCDAYALAFSGNLASCNIWLSMLNHEYNYYVANAEKINSEVEGTLGNANQKEILTKAIKANSEVKTARKQVIEAELLRDRAISKIMKSLKNR